ncbi:cell division cycle 48C [Tanacetum coccineum]|uniref:Cell division cycle 48C n=1 Tax=Tanacetum coccineum TaxID=301880 RepID=A0ABQ5GX09_9ASTR
MHLVQLCPGSVPGLRVLASSDSSVSESKTESDEEKNVSVVLSLGENEEPKLDLSKKKLRGKHSKHTKNVECEAVNNSDKKTDLMKKNRSVTNTSVKSSPMKPNSLLNDVSVNGNVKEGEDGPRFKDLGGMDELKREVIAPLYHPELPRSLGVRPMSGILFHGPPGCGKTRLAHAIANETGLPFYKISATELVSGITGDEWV